MGSLEGLSWVLSTGRMAFTGNSGSRQLQSGDRLFVYASRACLGRRSGNRGLVIGELTVEGSLQRLAPVLRLGGRTFTHDCAINVELLMRFGEGVDLAELASQMLVFPHERHWGGRLRRSLLRLPGADAEVLADSLRRAGPKDDAVRTYFE